MRRFVAAIVAVMSLVAGPAPAGSAPASPMEQCTAQWLDLKAAKPTYRPFLVQCLKNPPVAPVSKARAGTHTSPVAKLKRPNRMQVCAAKWRDMKATSTTNGLTYRQWSSQCLSHQ